MLFPACIYLEFYEFPVVCDILTVYNLSHNHPSKDKFKHHNLVWAYKLLKTQILNL